MYWEGMFPDCLLQSSASSISDNCPLLLGLNDLTQGRRRFHFESFWTRLEGFMDVVQQSWSQPVSAGCPLQLLADKFSRLLRDLQSWSQKKIGHINQQLQLARELLLQLEIAQDIRMLTSQEWMRRRLKGHVLGLSSLERTIARLRSRIAHARYRKREFYGQSEGGGQGDHGTRGEKGGNMRFLQYLVGACSTTRLYA
jgi:hypothetical protein